MYWWQQLETETCEHCMPCHAVSPCQCCQIHCLDFYSFLVAMLYDDCCFKLGLGLKHSDNNLSQSWFFSSTRLRWLRDKERLIEIGRQWCTTPITKLSLRVVALNDWLFRWRKARSHTAKGFCLSWFQLLRRLQTQDHLRLCCSSGSKYHLRRKKFRIPKAS